MKSVMLSSNKEDLTQFVERGVRFYLKTIHWVVARNFCYKYSHLIRLTEKLHLLVTVNMAEKQTQDIHLPGGFFLPKRQLMRFSALGLTSVICVAVSMIYSGDMISFDLSFNRNPTLYRKMGLVSHLFSYASWFGCSMWISFVGGLVMFNNLPRHVFGRLQSKLFPIQKLLLKHRKTTLDFYER